MKITKQAMLFFLLIYFFSCEVKSSVEATSLGNKKNELRDSMVTLEVRKLDKKYINTALKNALEAEARLVFQLKVFDIRRIRKETNLSIDQKFRLENEMLKSVTLLCEEKVLKPDVCMLESTQEQFGFDSYLVEFTSEEYCESIASIQIFSDFYKLNTSVKL